MAVKKKIRDLTIGEVRNICDKYNYFADFSVGCCCNHNCPLWNINGVCSDAISDLTEEQINQEIELKEEIKDER